MAKKTPAKKPAKKKTTPRKTAPKKAAPKKAAAKKAAPKKPAPKAKPAPARTPPPVRPPMAPPRLAPAAPRPTPPPLPPMTDLPPPVVLYQIAVGLSALDAIKGTPRFLRKFRMVHRANLSAFVFDRGNGDELRFFLTPRGSVVRGFDHEAPRSPFNVGHVWPGTFAGLPDALRSLVERAPTATADEDIFGEGETLFGEGAGAPGRLFPVTFAAWTTPGDGGWTRGTLADGAPESGAKFLLGCLTPDIDFLEKGWDPSVVHRIMANQPIADADIRKLLPDVDLARARSELDTMRYGSPSTYL